MRLNLKTILKQTKALEQQLADLNARFNLSLKKTEMLTEGDAGQAA